MIQLFAICWQDSTEPWGWAPASDDNLVGVPEDALPDGPFFWDLGSAQIALHDLLEKAADAYLPVVRDWDRARFKRETDQFESWDGKPRPGAYVSVQGGGRPVPQQPPAPKPLRSEEELREDARLSVERDWKIQTYQVPYIPKGI